MTEKEMILEQYKLYVEMADRISSRRAQTSKFYISVLSAMLALLAIVVEKKILLNCQALVISSVSLLGISLCILWYVNIHSYRQLNSGKFKVIHEMEQQLPFACYDKEWAFLGQGKKQRKYLQLTRIEQYIPFIVGIPYLIVFVYSLLGWAELL